MNKNWIDVSVDLSPELPTWPGDPTLSISKFHDMSKGAVANVSQLSLSAHTGTHMDSPFHFFNDKVTMSAWTPEVSMGKCKVFEVKDKVSITAKELKTFDIQKGDNIIIKTFNSSYEWFKKPFNENFVHFAEDGAAYIAEKKIQFVGIDYLSVGGPKNGIEVHHHILGAGIWIVEGLYLKDIAPGEYEFICLPVKIKGADGAPSRVLMRKI
ncbi:MAG: cyclase family protein [Cytophagaceae bacterium]|nr:cyclase family protein [Cytophagaceae bacterium]